MFQRWRNTVTRFMTGRYGLDSLGWFLLIVYGVLCVGGGSSPPGRYRCGSWAASLWWCWCCALGGCFPAASDSGRQKTNAICAAAMLCAAGSGDRATGCGISGNTGFGAAPIVRRSCACPFAGDGGRSPVPAATVSFTRCFFKWRSSPPAANKHRCSIAFSFPLPPTTINAGAVLLKNRHILQRKRCIPQRSNLICYEAQKDAIRYGAQKFQTVAVAAA